jgi:hypothetical protein
MDRRPGPNRRRDNPQDSSGHDDVQVEAIIGAGPGSHDGFVGTRASLPGYKSEWLSAVRHYNPEAWFGRSGARLVWFDKQGRVLTATYYYGEAISFHPMVFLREALSGEWYPPFHGRGHERFEIARVVDAKRLQPAVPSGTSRRLPSRPSAERRRRHHRRITSRPLQERGRPGEDRS